MKDSSVPSQLDRIDRRILHRLQRDGRMTADFNRLHGGQLIALPGVRQTRTFFVMKEVVDNAPLDF